MGKEKRQQRVRSAKGRNRGHRYERPFVWWANLNRKRREIFLKDSLKIADKLRWLHPETAAEAMGSIAQQWLLPPDTDVLSLSRYDQWEAYRATQEFASVIRRKTRAARRQGGS